MPPIPHDSLADLSRFLRLVKDQLELGPNKLLFQHLNCDDGSFSVGDLDNLLRPMPSLSAEKVDAVITRIGNIPWRKDNTIDQLYATLTAQRKTADPFDDAISRFLEPQLPQFQPGLLGTYLVYRAAGDTVGVARALLRVHAIIGRTGMQYTFLRLHGQHAGYKAKGRVITQQSRFMFFGYSLDPDNKKEGGLTLMALTPPVSQFASEKRPYDILNGLHLMSVNFSEHQAAAMKLVAVRENDLSGRSFEFVRDAYGGVVSFEDAAVEISEKTPYSADNFYDPSSKTGMLVNNPGGGGILTYTLARPRTKTAQGETTQRKNRAAIPPSE